MSVAVYTLPLDLQNGNFCPCLTVFDIFFYQSATKWVETLPPKLGFFTFLLTSARGNNYSIFSPSLLCNVVPMFELPVENNKHPNFE